MVKDVLWLSNSMLKTQKPLIVSAELRAADQERLNRLRREYFPAERNFLDAHLTLFHAFPAHACEALIAALEAKRSQLPMAVRLTKVVSLGLGFAVSVDAPSLKIIHRSWQKEFNQLLTRQDSQPLWPHITLQNKSTAAKAKHDLADVQQRFLASDSEIKAFVLWQYDDGPWIELRRFLAIDDRL